MREHSADRPDHHLVFATATIRTTRLTRAARFPLSSCGAVRHFDPDQIGTSRPSASPAGPAGAPILYVSRGVEAAGDVDTLLDKTGTVTFGNRLATEIIVVPGVTEHEAAEAALLSSDADETAEGRSIITLVQEKYHARRQAAPADARFIEFSATTRLSGVDIGKRKLRKGAVDSVLKFAREQAGQNITEPPAFRAAVDKIARSGGTPLGLVEGDRILAVIHLKDVVKPDVRDRFNALP